MVTLSIPESAAVIRQSILVGLVARYQSVADRLAAAVAATIANIARFTAVVTLGVLAFAPSVSGQTYSLDPLAWAVPIAQRPPELQAAKDLILRGNQGLRLRAEVWVLVDPCPKKKPGEHCLVRTETQGRFFVGPVWDDVVIPDLEVEKLWLLHKGGVWSTDTVRRASDGNFEFEKGPPLPGNTNIDVIVKLRGSTELLQIRYRTVYQKGRG
jgi:hypothetical protein